MVGVAGEVSAEELCQDGRAPRLRMAQLLQHQHACRAGKSFILKAAELHMFLVYSTNFGCDEKLLKSTLI